MNARGFIVPSRIVGVLFLLPALLSAGLAVWFYTSSNSFLRNAISTQGVVVDQKPSSGNDGTTYATEFEFQDGTGSTHRSVTSWSSNPPAYAVGSQVEVLYVARNPSDARLRSFTSLWLGAMICGILAVVPLFFSLVFIWLVPFTIKRVWPSPTAA